MNDIGHTNAQGPTADGIGGLVADQVQDLRALVGRTRKRLTSTQLAMGLSALVAVPTGFLLVGSLLDLLVPLPMPGRVAVWSVFWALALWLLGGGVVWPMLRPPSLAQVAWRIERTVPRMHNRLVTVLDEELAARPDVDSGFVARLLEQTRTRLAGYRIEQVVDPRPARMRALWASGVLLATAVALVLLQRNLATAAARMLLPTAAIAPASWVKLDVQPGDTEVLEGEALTLAARVTRGEVERLTLALRDRAGHWTRYPMAAARGDASAWSFRLEKAGRDLWYRVEGGGTWTDTYRIALLRRPTVRSVSWEVLWPQYANVPQPQPVDPEAVEVSAPVGSALRVHAAASADAVRGEATWLQPSEVTSRQATDFETVWFDDDTPADARLTGNWRWVSELAYSGARSHTVGFSGGAYGLTTRLSPLTIEPGQRFMIYTRLDEHQPASQLRLKLATDEGDVELCWDSERDPLDDKARKQSSYAGLLPGAGRWVRLEMPAEAWGPKRAGKAVKVQGLTITTSGGSMLLDRPGAVRQVERAITSTQWQPMQTYAMTADADGRWTAHLPIDADGHVQVRFFNHRDHASLPTRPMSVVATVDQPPVVMAEKPGQSVTLTTREPMPVMVRAFDDLGVFRIGVQTGPGADQFGDVRWLEQLNPPQRVRTLWSALDPDALGMKAGDSIAYRLVTEDGKGQRAVSDSYRLSLAGEASAAPVADASRRRALSGLLDGLEKLTQLRAGAMESLARLLPHDRTTGDETELNRLPLVTLTNEDGTPLTAEQLKAMYKEQLEAMPDSQRVLYVEQLSKQWQQQEEMRLQLAEQFDEAAKVAEQSPTALPLEATTLRMMGNRLQGQSGIWSDPNLTPEQRQQMLMDLMAAQQLSPLEERELAQLREQMKQLMASQGALAQDPAAAQAQMEALMAQLQAQRALAAGGMANQNIENRRMQLQQMRNQLEQMKNIVAQAKSADQLNQVSRQQAEMDPRVLEQLAEARRMLEAAGAPELAEMNDLPAPWQAPGERMDAAPLERDTPPEAAPKNPGADPAATPIREPDLAWWDKPVETLPLMRTLEQNDRFASRDTRPVERAPQAPGGMMSPRQQLMQHQDLMYQQLTENANALSNAQQRMAGAMDQTQQIMSRMSGQALDPSQTPPGQGGQMAPMQAVQQLQQLMASPQMQAMSALAQMAAPMPMAGPAGAMGAGMPQGMMGMNMMMPSGGQSTSGTRPGELLMMDLSGLDELTASQRAALYRLPPQLRVPLIEGMQERGPQAYQPLIDAYYRQLSEPQADK